MFNKLAIRSAVLGLALAFSAGPATADPPKGCNPKTQKCLCHNIGGPRDLGANCDMTGNCSFTLDTGETISVVPNNFLGIIIGVALGNEGALAAHLAHGDGFILATFDPALHLASTGQNHQAANVECLATRAITEQPPEPGN